MFYTALLNNIISVIIAYYITKLLFIKNWKTHHIIYVFNIYSFTCFSLILFYISSFNNSTYIKMIITLVHILFYLRMFNNSENKYNERFISMMYSFGYTRKTYFNSFLIKKLFIHIVESFFYGTSTFYLFSVIFLSDISSLNLKILIPVMLYFFAGLIKLYRQEMYTKQ